MRADPVFETYDAIFNRRGDAYHQAMRTVPRARDKEFQAGLECVRLRPGDVVCDVPSGGGYLIEHLPPALDVRLVAVDPSEVFARKWADPRIEAHLAPLHRLPMEAASVDAIVSIAGLHHVDDRPAVFRELRRVLRPGGQLSILEVCAGSGTDRFLNDFVDTYCSMGHKGRFVDDGFRRDVEEAGFHINRDELCRYTWDFPDEERMAEFVQLMFGLDKADQETVLAGVEDILGISRDENGAKMNWELQRLVAS